MFQEIRMKTKAKVRVKRGARLLDKKAPGWAKKIKPDDLAMDSTLYCILGQSFADYYSGLSKIDALDDDERYGFDTQTQDPLEYRILENFWINEVEKRIAV